MSVSKMISYAIKNFDKEKITGEHKKYGIKWIVTKGEGVYIIIVESSFLRSGPILIEKIKGVGGIIIRDEIYWTGENKSSFFSIAIDDMFDSIKFDFSKSVTYYSREYIETLFKEFINERIPTLFD